MQDVPFFRRLLVPDKEATGLSPVYVFLEMVALAFAFAAVDALVNGKYLLAGGALLAALLFFVSGLKWPWIKDKLVAVIKPKIGYAVVIPVTLILGACIGVGLFRFFSSKNNT